MTYKINGLDPSQFSYLSGMSDEALARHNAVRVTADKDRGFPCRVTLEDARAGESLILLHHVSHDVATPYRSAYAIYIRENAAAAAAYEDETPPLFEGRPLSSWGSLDVFRSQKIGFVFQAFYLLPTLTALENVQVPMFEGRLSARRRAERARDGIAGPHCRRTQWSRSLATTTKKAPTMDMFTPSVDSRRAATWWHRTATCCGIFVAAGLAACGGGGSASDDAPGSGAQVTVA